MYTVDVIIPTYKPDKSFFRVLDMLNKQTIKPETIIIMNTEEKYFHQLTYGSDFSDKYKNCKVYHLSKREFDHGATRNRGVAKSKADYFVMMTQDADPADEYLLENLLKPLVEGKAAVSYAKQLPKADCNPIECYTRGFNYPDESVIKGEEDIKRLGIKTYFCSDVCAAYNRQFFLDLGGFVKRAIFNEDMIYAAKAAKAGQKIAYCADAKVYHSHNYSAKEQFHRNFDLGVSQADHPEVFGGLPSEGEGIRMVKQTAAYLWKNGYKRLIPTLVWTSAAKWFGFRFGKAYQKLPRKMVLRFTASPIYWKKK
ncbi:MAG: glycosyltransferase [Lachnospiraceae bacterium]|nr:glycosyltransferase [Lachnospiraceae bacterium]